MAVEYTKPLPSPDLDTAGFWEGCKAHELRAQRCDACGAFRWPPHGICPQCSSWDFHWVKIPETGKVYSYTVVHHASAPAFAEDVPYVVATIRIDGTDDKVRLMSNVVGCPCEEVRVGMLVRVFFEDVTEEVSLPKFRPA